MQDAQVTKSLHIVTILYLKGLPGEISVNSAGPDEMPPYAAFHLGLNCLPKYLLPVSRMTVLITHEFKNLQSQYCFIRQ